ncbi:hypothetical protein GCM10010329_52530 [Streptomyces spiroverticillatus]|uniref:Uncharacterized protein n=1 Tax=Streptomyces finlayi TaxID=67296 RepID=A0A919CCD5_9ACTN|nr:hypothetical protein [Streptomyces finlayi]GHA22661.1 hypothetical protein GCM10010329_52530 [Streptomyces spiroverticillatus]GHD04530.1 hypothetical protein GCM10010334_53470 [Streptomyces finlayi]
MFSTPRKRLAVATAAVALGGGLVLPAAATAAPAAPAGRSAADVRVQGTAPACVTRDVIKQKKQVTVRNNCGKTMHVKVVINNGPDGGCWTYQHGQGGTWKWKIGSYGKIVTC